MNQFFVHRCDLSYSTPRSRQVISAILCGRIQQHIPLICLLRCLTHLNQPTTTQSISPLPVNYMSIITTCNAALIACKSNVRATSMFINKHIDLENALVEMCQFQFRTINICDEFYFSVHRAMPCVSRTVRRRANAEDPKHYILVNGGPRTFVRCIYIAAGAVIRFPEWEEFCNCYFTLHR